MNLSRFRTTGLVPLLLLFFGSALFLVLLNPLHELSHYWFWTRSGIPACLMYNYAVPEGGFEAMQTQAKMIPGLLAGPAFNVILGLLLTPVHQWLSSRHWRFGVFILISSTFLLRPLNLAFSAILRQPSDEILLLQNLSSNSHTIEGWLLLLALAIVPSAYFAHLAVHANYMSRCLRVAPLVATVISLLVVYIIVEYAAKPMRWGPTPWTEPVGAFCAINFGA